MTSYMHGHCNVKNPFLTIWHLLQEKQHKKTYQVCEAHGA